MAASIAARREGAMTGSPAVWPMAYLIAPRPFMVERGHFDTVAPDETVAYEFAKVRHLYNARLKLPPDRCHSATGVPYPR